jgi:hypothetical protein
MNTESRPGKDLGMTPVEFEERLKTSTVVEPDILLTSNDPRFPDFGALENLNQYRHQVRYDSKDIPGPVKQQLDDIQFSADIGREIASSTSYKIDQALERLEKIDNNTKPKQRKTNKAQILRDPEPNSMLEDILKADKPKGAHQLTWARFQLASVILFFSGLRINEIACIRK